MAKLRETAAGTPSLPFLWMLHSHGRGHEEDGRASVLGSLPEDATATVLSRVHPAIILVVCSPISRSIHALCHDMLRSLIVLDLSIGGTGSTYAEDGMDTFAECAAVREACHGASRLPASVPNGGVRKLHDQALRVLVKHMPQLSVLSLRGRLLVPSRSTLEALSKRPCREQPLGSCEDLDCVCQRPSACFGHACLSGAPGRITQLDLSFAAVMRPAIWGSFFPRSLLCLEAKGFYSNRLDLVMHGLARSPLLQVLNIQGSGSFPTADQVNPYETLRTFAGTSMYGGAGCHQVATLCLGHCGVLRLLGSNALLGAVAANTCLTTLDVRHILTVSIPCLRARRCDHDLGGKAVLTCHQKTGE